MANPVANSAPTILAWCGINVPAADIKTHTAGCPKCSYQKGIQKSTSLQAPFNFLKNSVWSFVTWLFYATVALHILTAIAALINAVTGLYFDALGWPSMICMFRRAFRVDPGWKDSKMAIQMLVSYISILELTLRNPVIANRTGLLATNNARAAIIPLLATRAQLNASVAQLCALPELAHGFNSHDNVSVCTQMAALGFLH